MREKTVLVASYKERFIWFDGWITQAASRRFKKILDILNKKKCAPITFYIRGPGGDPYATLSMMNDIVNSGSPVATVAHGYVCSGCFTMTQAGEIRLATEGTIFSFHPAVAVDLKGKDITQEGLASIIRGLRLLDASQMAWFIKKARPLKEVFDLFEGDTTIDLKKARELNIIDCYYKEGDFRRDKILAMKILAMKIMRAR